MVRVIIFRRSTMGVKAYELPACLSLEGREKTPGSVFSDMHNWQLQNKHNCKTKIVKKYNGEARHSSTCVYAPLSHSAYWKRPDQDLVKTQDMSAAVVRC